MGEPTQGERSLPHTTFFEDPAFLEWARRRGTPVTRGTPTGELTELNSAWEFEKREARRREDDRRRPRPAPPREAQPVVDDVRLRKRIRELWGQGSPELRATAEREVHALRPISRLLFGSHQFDEERERWTFMRHYFRALGITFGDGEPGEEELLDHVLKEEKVYRIELARREDARERAGRPHRQAAALRKWAKKRSMDLVDAFDPGIAVYDIDSAMQKPDWMENGLVSIEQDDDMRVVLRYETGPPLKFPAKAIDFNRTYADAVVDLVARRHTASGRLMPFAFYDRNVDLLDDLPETDAITNPNDRALIALPRFDADLTPLVLSYYSDEQFRWRLVRGVLKVTAAMSLYKLRRPAASLTARTLAATAPVVTGVRAAAQRVVIAVSIHGVTRSAAAHLARAAYTYYLTHAIAINTYGLLGTEIVLSLGGHDAGPVSQGDTLTMATKADDVARGTRALWNRLRVEVTEVNPSTRRVTGIVRAIEPITDDVARTEFNLGKNIIGEAGITGPAARGVTDTATASRSFDVPMAPVVPPGAVAQGKQAVQLAPDPRPAFAIAKYEAARTELLRGLERLGSKFNANALETIRNISADAIRASGISPADLGKLANALAHAGAVTRRFVNDFHAVPGFERVLLTWARKGNFRTGSAFVMRYATTHLDPRDVRFEWPVSINDTKWGAEVFARHVDIVVTGGTAVAPGRHMHLELKSWTERILQRKTSSAPGGIGYQLIRDTALFRPDNIRWVFDGRNGKVTRAAVIRAFEKVIADDPYLRQQWGGDPAQIRAQLEKVIEVS